MQSVLSRNQILPSGPSSSQHVPRKSSSFLSLRREKDKSPASQDPFLITFDSSGPSRSTRPAYFDAYPRPKSSPNIRTSKPKAQRVSPQRNTPSTAGDSQSSHQDLRELGCGVPSSEPSYAFPSFESTDDVSTPTNGKHYIRTRSRTGPSRRSNWRDTPSTPQHRFSGTSTQHTETPPHTPIDAMPSSNSMEHFPVVVAAPISGVEMMDALVDGMNGRDDLSERSTSITNRARFGIPGHHPLYQPPLPAPPPGVVLGGGKSRRPMLNPKPNYSQSSSSSDDDLLMPSLVARPRRRQPRRPSSSRVTSNPTTLSPSPSQTSMNLGQNTTQSANITRETNYHNPLESPLADKRKTVIPSISEIIRTHAPPESQLRSRPVTARSSSMYTHSQGHSTVLEELESEPESPTVAEEAEMMSRSSIDSVADEVQRTLRHQTIVMVAPTAPPSSFPQRHSAMSDNISICSPRSDTGAGSSIYSSSAASSHQPSSPFDTASFLAMSKPSPSQAVAQYLRSARLTTLLKLTRTPHASQDHPLTVSLSDLGNPTGFPVLVFLGLGCVRHIMGLYDEMAECLGLRLITIDRWGLGRTEPRSKSTKGIVQWASVVEEILDLLRIEKCSVIAHSAGAPYALSFANKLPNRIQGDICLLAPWVGGNENGGYKWLKYVPNGILKTAQAAEWKLQAWMIGKPPTIAYQGIGYNAQPSSPAKSKSSPGHRSSSPRLNGSLGVVYPSHPAEGRPRPSIGSSSFSEYDDLGDFDGRFESRSTLEAGTQYSHTGNEIKMMVNKRKTSKSFLERLKGSPSSHPQALAEDKPHTGKRLKALRSMSSLKSRSSSQSHSKKMGIPSPHLPVTLHIEPGLGFDELGWIHSTTSSEVSSIKADTFASTLDKRSMSGPGSYPRNGGRRSMSFTSPKTPLSMPSSPSPSATNSLIPDIGPGSAYQAALGNALIAASHAESAKGTHNDLLQILNHENYSWGFSYSSYPHKVRVWYGDRDEKIAENAVRWMEQNMGEDRCLVKVVKGADHGLMYKTSVVVEVLEKVLSFWKTDT